LSSRDNVGGLRFSLSAICRRLKSGEGDGSEAAKQRLEARKLRLEAELEDAKARHASGEHKA